MLTVPPELLVPIKPPALPPDAFTAPSARHSSIIAALLLIPANPATFDTPKESPFAWDMVIVPLFIPTKPEEIPFSEILFPSAEQFVIVPLPLFIAQNPLA